MRKSKEITATGFATPRMPGQAPTAEQSLYLVSPFHRIDSRTDRHGNTRRVFRGGANPWQKFMLGAVNLMNGRGALDQVDAVHAPQDFLNIITNDAFRLVANNGNQPHAQDRRANTAEAILGWFPVIPLAWDVPMLLSRWKRRARGEGFGASLPAFWSTLTDIPSRVFIPGSAASTRQAVGYYQQAMYHVLSEDMYKTLSASKTVPAPVSFDKKTTRDKYELMVRQVDPKLIQAAEKTMRTLTEQVVGRKLQYTEALPRLDGNTVAHSLSRREAAVYFLGQNLLDSVAIVQ